jgi:prepilin-type N-terminal cleavage/methylation domain-containing protein
MSPVDRVRDEQGFTLVELIISMAVLSILIVPLTSSFLLGLLESTSAEERIADSTAAQLLSAYVPRDIQSADAVYVNRHDCLPPPFNPATDVVRLQLNWSDPDTIGATTVVSYIDRLGADGVEHILHRAECVTTAGVTTSGSTLLARHLDRTAGFVPTCDGDAACTDARPKAVTLHVKAKSPDPSPRSSYAAFEFDLRGTRRVGT